jgi:DNA-directed RNA polymerase subunit M/transcription elongation factor TFIIS
MPALNIEKGEFIKDISCVCKKSGSLMYVGHDRDKIIVECHNCFKYFDKVKELSTEAVSEAVNELKAQLKAAQLKKEKKGRGKKNKDIDEDEEVAIEEDDIDEEAEE